MQHLQYEWMLRNRPQGADRLQPLDALAPQIVKRAAAGWHRRRAAEQAWDRVAEPGWLAHTQPTAIEHGVLVVAVQQTACFSLLRRRTQTLGRELARLAPGVCGVRFVRTEVREQTES